MANPLHRLAGEIHRRITTFGYKPPSRALIHELLSIAYFASLKTEEGRFVRGSVTYADPAQPEPSPPQLRRADFPSFHQLGRRIPLTVESFTKIARAVDVWSGSVSVYGRSTERLFIWGIVDQLVQRNTRLHREARGGFIHPGLFTVSIEGIGQLAVYHGDYYLGSLHAQTVSLRENDALHSPALFERIAPSLNQFAIAIRNSLPDDITTEELLFGLYEGWISAVSRLCIGVRRYATGGALVISPQPRCDVLDVKYPFLYSRLSSGFVLRELDDAYQDQLAMRVRTFGEANSVPYVLHLNLGLAEADAQDREDELSGAVKLVTSLAAVDGAVLLDPTLSVAGFGVKIGNCAAARAVYDGPSTVRASSKARRIDLTQYGTRHTSMLRYCKHDPAAVGIVISQDGHVRVVYSASRRLVLWDQVKLLDHDNYTSVAARSRRLRSAERRRACEPQRFGYTPTPKSLQALLAVPRK